MHWYCLDVLYYTRKLAVTVHTMQISKMELRENPVVLSNLALPMMLRTITFFTKPHMWSRQLYFILFLIPLHSLFLFLLKLYGFIMNLFPEQHPENWTEEIQKEWKILKNYMPGKFVLCSYYNFWVCLWVIFYHSMFRIVILIVFWKDYL